METVELMKALGHETRLRVVHLLLQKETLCVCDLFEVLQLPQPTVSRHLKILRDKGLVSDFRNNQWVHYCLVQQDDPRIMDILESVVALAKVAAVFAQDSQRLKQTVLADCC